jgi:hypothetical protein
MMNRRELLACAASAAVVAILYPFDPSFVARAAAPVDSPITITKTDGTTVKGKITSYDREKVTMDVITKPKDPVVSTTISWDDIKKVSNGLTREKAIRKWKGEQHMHLCQSCFGDGKTFCPTCKGTAHDPASSAGCPTCKGAAQVACTTSKCKSGNLPCPNPKCLKLTDPGWYKRPDGSMWKKFTEKNGYREWSEHHCGEIIDKVNGEYTSLGECPDCGGVGSITDPACRGTSQMPCPVCSKKTTSPPCPDKCDSGIVTCATCKGSGVKF